MGGILTTANNGCHFAIMDTCNVRAKVTLTTKLPE